MAVSAPARCPAAELGEGDLKSDEFSETFDDLSIGLELEDVR